MLILFICLSLPFLFILLKFYFFKVKYKCGWAFLFLLYKLGLEDPMNRLLNTWIFFIVDVDGVAFVVVYANVQDIKWLEGKFLADKYFWHKLLRCNEPTIPSHYNHCQYSNWILTLKSVLAKTFYFESFNF